MEHHPCELCPEHFNSKAQLASHRFKKHGIKKPMRLFISAPYCSACLRHYHARERVITHVTYNSEVCKRYYIAHHTPMEVVESNALDKFERQTRLKDNFKAGRAEGWTAGLKVFRRPGPISPDVVLPRFRGKHTVRQVNNLLVNLEDQ